MLTYSPEYPEKRGKIKVVVKNKGYKIYYDDNFRADYLRKYFEMKKIKKSLIKTKKLMFKDKALSMIISDFLMEKEEGYYKGKILVNIQIKTPDGKISLEENKIILAKEDTISLSLSFNWLNQGEYNIIVNVKDQLSEKTTIDFLKTRIN